MSVTINDREYHGIIGNLVGFIVAICTLLWVGIIFICIGAIFIAPLAFVFYLIMRIIS